MDPVVSGFLEVTPRDVPCEIVGDLTGFRDDADDEFPFVDIVTLAAHSPDAPMVWPATRRGW